MEHLPKPRVRHIKVYRLIRANRVVPELRLSGKWMEQLGFHVGDHVEVTIREGLLIIQPVKAS